MIVALILAVRVAAGARCPVIIGQNSSTVHNATIDCGDHNVLNKKVLQCQWDLLKVAMYGYPWFPKSSQRNSRHNLNAPDRNISLRDALDSLNHVCRLYDRSQTCLEEKNIPDYCLTTVYQSYMKLHLDFQFICHQQQQDENLVRSLQCLYDNRMMVMLYFHIMDRCGGMGILDGIMRHFKNVWFYVWDIKPVCSYTLTNSFLCIPRSVISTCIRGIIEDHCGTMTADLVQDYLFYYQDWYGQTLQSAGLEPNICDNDISSDMVPSRLPIPSGHTKLTLFRRLEITTAGTALDTVRGKYELAIGQSLSEKDLCTTDNILNAYSVCAMSADDRSEIGEFNILQFAHHLLSIPVYYHGTGCSRLEEFTACWNLLQETCGPKVRGMEQLATLFMEGCKIQSELDTVGCHWQDMLLPHYMQASRVTVWPMVIQCLMNPMFLESAHYSRSVNDLMHDLDTVISMLQPGVEEISMRCGSHPAKQLTSLLNKLHYLQRDAARFAMNLAPHP